MFLPAELIKKKRNGGTHSQQEIEFLVNSFTSGVLPEYQMSAWLMATFFAGLTPDETHTLTQTMKASGQALSFTPSQGFIVDKHSTGGVGDKTSLILAPIVAACGLIVPMISGRGLGHTGGTVDKLESIPGFSTQISLEKLYQIIKETGFGMIGQTENICPADKRIYALRDATATVESQQLICASIMSKKFAEGLNGLVLDVKFGSGAFMKTLESAEHLAKSLIDIGVKGGLKMAAFLTDMSQPLGRMVGNSLEIEECLSILQNKTLGNWQLSDLADTRNLSLELAGAMIFLSGKTKSFQAGRDAAEKALFSGLAYEKFEKMCSLQGGNLSAIPKAKKSFSVKAKKNGFLSAYDCEKIGIAAIVLGAGRAKSEDKIDPSAGIEVMKKIGDSIGNGEDLFILYGTATTQLEDAALLLDSSVNIGDDRVPSPQLIMKRIFA